MMGWRLYGTVASQSVSHKAAVRHPWVTGTEVVGNLARSDGDDPRQGPKAM